MDYLLNIGNILTLFSKDAKVLNLIINGLPSKRMMVIYTTKIVYGGFKPYYKWITF